MTELTIEIAAIVGAAAGGTMGLLMSWAAGMYGRRSYSSAAIVFRATAEDAAKIRSKIVNSLVWEDPPEQFIRMDEGPVQRGNGNGGPTTPKPDIVPKPQYPGGYISLEGAQPLRGRRFQPLPDELDAYCPQDDTTNSPPEEP